MTLTLRLRGDGLDLVADAFGDASAPPLLLFHGGGQTRHAWGAAAARIAAAGWRVIVPDLRGHGDSDRAPAGSYSMAHFAGDVRALAAALPAPPVLVGASLGGISSLLAAGEAPRAPVRALVLVDIAHRPEPAGVMRVLDFMRARPDGFASIEEAAAAVREYLPQRSAPDKLDGLKRNLREQGGRWVWHWDPALLDEISRGPAMPTPERLLAAARSIDAPIGLVRGGLSDVLSDDAAAEFCAAIPRAARIDVAGAGHMVAGDRNDRFLDALAPFLRALL